MMTESVLGSFGPSVGVKNLGCLVHTLETAIIANSQRRQPQLPHQNIDSRTCFWRPILVKMSTAELATSYAALILADDGVDITVCDRSSLRFSMFFLERFNDFVLTQDVLIG